MEKVITNKSTRYYYQKGDEIINTTNEEIFVVEKVDVETKKIYTTNGYIFDLTTEIRPTDETKKNAKVIDKRRKFSDKKRGFKSKFDQVFFAKVREDAKIPSRRDEDGCYDIYASFDEEYILIQPNEIKLISTGIISAFHKKLRAELRERGSSGTKGMSRRAGQIDSGFRGEWLFPINNTTNKDIVITKNVTDVTVYEDRVEYPYTKAIGQIAFEYVPRTEVIEKTPDEVRAITSERGEGKLGSSGK